MRFDNRRFCKRQSETDTLPVLGKTAAVKSLEDVVQVLKMDTSSIVFYNNLNGRVQVSPFNVDSVALLCMIEGVFH